MNDDDKSRRHRQVDVDLSGIGDLLEGLGHLLEFILELVCSLFSGL